MKKLFTLLFVSFVLLWTTTEAQIITNPDSVLLYPGDTVLVDVLVNDYEISNDSIFVVGYSYPFPPISGYSVVANRYIKVKAKSHWWGAPSGLVDSVVYTVNQVNGPATAQGTLYIYVTNNSFNVLDNNNISARFSATGNHFWDLQGSAKFFAPKNTVKSPTYNSTLWIGGKESNTGQLHLSAERFRQVGTDFEPGPVSTVYDSIYNKRWSRIWKLTTADVLHHIANYNAPNYTPIPDLAEWPAHGDTTKGQLWNIAPFHDSNNNGIYEPMAGDYPLIRGNMALFFVFNDVRNLNTESGGTPLGIEVHGMAYAFDQPANPMLHNTIFMHYDIINRSANQYDSTWIGVFNDFDLGYAYDDYIGTHVKHGAVYAYNGAQVDGSGQPYAYGANPPVMAMQLLGGPFMDPDGLDNPKTDSLGNPLCNASLNGANFGDAIVDNERLGLQRSMYFDNDNTYKGDPKTASEYYNYIRGMWRDTTRLMYGGNGHINSGAYGPQAAFMFPADSDSCHFGLGGVPPNGPAFWTEITAGNQPYDRRIVASSGSFTLMPGASHPLDVAWIFAYDPLHNAPFDTLVNWLDSLKSLFTGNAGLFDPALTVVSLSVPALSNLLLYPNPARDHITIKGLSSEKPAHYQIFSLTGQVVGAGTVSNGESLAISHLIPGLYIIRVQSGTEVISRKFVRE